MRLIFGRNLRQQTFSYPHDSNFILGSDASAGDRSRESQNGALNGSTSPIFATA
jgi:hypothetical protein